MRDEDTEPFDLDDESPEARQQEEQIVREYYDSFPKEGDKLFVESDSGARLDALGTPTPESPRSIAGRRGLYSEGYLLAGDRLVDSLTAAPHEDALVYPILYLYRHNIELELKELLSYFLCSLSGFEGAKLEEKLRELGETHSLQGLWMRIEGHFPKWNEGSPVEAQQAFRRLLYELDDHDPTGEAGRYETDRKGNQTLARLRIVDLGKLKQGIHKIFNYLGLVSEGIRREAGWRSEMASR